MTTLSSIITPTNIVTATSTDTLTNKTIDADNNTITNVDLAGDVKGTLPAANGGTGLTSPGTTGNVLTSNGTAWTSAAPAPSAGSLAAIASGALANGDKVIINADGTVSVVEGSKPAVFESASTDWISATYDSTNDRVVIAYSDDGNSGFGTAVVGTVSGTSISFGTPVVFESASMNITSATYDSTNDRVVIAYRDDGNSGRGTAVVGTVSGTSISFGTPVVFETGATTSISATYDSTNDRVVIAYEDTGNSAFGTAVVGTVSGTSISFGTPVVFESASTDTIAATYDSTNNRVVIAYRDDAASDVGTAIVGTVSGTSISFGTPVVFQNNILTQNNISATYDSTNDRVVIAYTAVSANRAIVGTVSGTSISFGTAIIFENASIEGISATYDSTNDRVVIAYRNSGNSNRGTAIVGTVSGTSISFGTALVFTSAGTAVVSATYDSTNDRVVIAYRDLGNSNFGTAIALNPNPNLRLTNLTSENYIGISNGAYADATTATIQIVGSVDDAQSALTAGQSYFVQVNNTLSETPDTPSVFAGTAVSATKLIVKG